jgi:5-(carboxyamino)imidazole ribonucleotide mutase
MEAVITITNNTNIIAHPIASIVMGSHSDLPIMQLAAEMLERFGVLYEMSIVSAHRTPERLMRYAQGAYERGIRVIIAGAGGAAHLPGMIAASTALPVIGVPIKSSNSLDGWDSILSIIQMPTGVPVATVALNGGANAGLLALQILAHGDENLYQKLLNYKSELREMVVEKANHPPYTPLKL